MAQALTRCRHPLNVSPSAARHALPSMAMALSPVAVERSAIHRPKQAAKILRSSAASTRLKVSWLGIPLFSGKYCLSHCSRASPKRAISSKLSAPQITAHRVTPRMSPSACFLVRFTRGSGTSAK